jgi:hypothetical protein
MPPTRKGPFEINAISVLPMPTGYTDRHSFPGVISISDTVETMRALGVTHVKLNLSSGFMRNFDDNDYDPTIPIDHVPADVVTFAHKLRDVGVSCYVQPFAHIFNRITGSDGHSDRPQPRDRRLWMANHSARIIALARLAEQAGCSWFGLFGDETEHLAADPSLTAQWVELLNSVRSVFTGRTTMVSWFNDGSRWLFEFPLPLVQRFDAVGIGFFPFFTANKDASLEELIRSYTHNSRGNNILAMLDRVRNRYEKPIFITDRAFHSFDGANIDEGEIFRRSRNTLTLDYQEQVDQYEAFFAVMTERREIIGVAFSSWDRMPFEWKEQYWPPFLGQFGEGIRGKPAEETVRRWFNHQFQ